MEQKENTSNQGAWIQRLEEELMKRGVKPGTFLHGKTILYIPKEEE